MTPSLDPEGAHLAALRRLADFRGAQVLEMGCGDGRLTVGIAAEAARVLARRPDLHAHGDPEPLARELHGSLQTLLRLRDHVLVYPSHYGGSVCGRGLSSNPFSTIGFERRHNRALQHSDVDAFVSELLVDVPPPPADQARIVAANRRGRTQLPA